MKAQEFYVELTKALSKGFHVTNRSKLHENAPIRLAKEGSHKSFDPLSAVIDLKTGKYVSINDVIVKAPSLLGLHTETVESLAAAADAEGSPIVRKRLEKALGL